MLIKDRFFDAFHALDYAHEYPETIYNADVYLFPASYTDFCEKYLV